MFVYFNFFLIEVSVFLFRNICSFFFSLFKNYGQTLQDLIYILNAEERKNVENIFHVIHCVKPDVTYCPVLYPLTSLLLHYISDGMAFACIMKLINNKQNYLSQTKADHISSAYLVMKITKKYAISICLF